MVAFDNLLLKKMMMMIEFKVRVLVSVSYNLTRNFLIRNFFRNQADSQINQTNE